jgi:hypothetical protein
MSWPAQSTKLCWITLKTKGSIWPKICKNFSISSCSLWIQVKRSRRSLEEKLPLLPLWSLCLNSSDREEIGFWATLSPTKEELNPMNQFSIMTFTYLFSNKMQAKISKTTCSTLNFTFTSIELIELQPNTFGTTKS